MLRDESRFLVTKEQAMSGTKRGFVSALIKGMNECLPANQQLVPVFAFEFRAKEHPSIASRFLGRLPSPILLSSGGTANEAFEFVFASFLVGQSSHRPAAQLQIYLILPRIVGRECGIEGEGRLIQKAGRGKETLRTCLFFDRCLRQLLSIVCPLSMCSNRDG